MTTDELSAFLGAQSVLVERLQHLGVPEGAHGMLAREAADTLEKLVAGWRKVLALPEIDGDADNLLLDVRRGLQRRARRRPRCAG